MHAVVVPSLIWFLEYLSNVFVESAIVLDVGFYVVVVAVIAGSCYSLRWLSRNQNVANGYWDEAENKRDSVAFFTGRWQIISDIKPPHPEQVFDLKPSFEAFGGPKGSAPNNGTWRIVAGEARIEWTNTGWKDSLRREPHVVRKFTREPGISWDGPIHNTAIAVKIG